MRIPSFYSHVGHPPGPPVLQPVSGLPCRALIVQCTDLHTLVALSKKTACCRFALNGSDFFSPFFFLTAASLSSPLQSDSKASQGERMLLMCHMLSAWLTLLALVFKVQDTQAALTELLFATWRMEDRLCWGGKLTVVSDLRGRGERIKELIKSTVNI